ncbi:MAG: glutamine amidotransferase, partial [Desulfovibrionaceae bacterium]|nr:glutamine amidotransferase [Desulfovibrionaceae bacterium]
MLPKLLIVETGSLDSTLAGFESFSQMFLSAADYSGCAPICLNAQKESLPSRPEQFAGALITGSPAMVTDREPWSETLAAWLLRALDCGVKVLGVCYGHQLLARAMGGVVDYHPCGLELGTHRIELNREAQQKGHPLLPPLPAVFSANLSHHQSVV